MACRRRLPLRPATGDFDHHQRTSTARGTKRRALRVVFGLVCGEFGRTGLRGRSRGGRRRRPDRSCSPSTQDTGQRLTRSLIDGVSLMTVNGIIGGFQCTLDESVTPEQERDGSMRPCVGPGDPRPREVASPTPAQRAAIVREAISAAADPRIVELPVSPVEPGARADAPDALFVSTPTARVSAGGGTRESARSKPALILPAAWGGRKAPLVASRGRARTVLPRQCVPRRREFPRGALSGWPSFAARP